jgi:hypothetical protein
VTNDIAVLSATPNLSKADRALLKNLQKASNTLTRVALNDGKLLRSLHTILGRVTAYQPPLESIRSNLLAGFTAEYDFVDGLIDELPQSAEATAIAKQFAGFQKTAGRVKNSGDIPRFTALYDAAKSKLDKILVRANDALIIPFPSDLSQNSVFTRINGVSFRTSADQGTENSFVALSTGTNITISLSASANPGGRGIQFMVPNVQFGAFRYGIPDLACFTNRTGIYPPEVEVNTGATNGSVFINTTGTEVYGSFSCSGPGFNVTDGRFRITIAQP